MAAAADVDTKELEFCIKGLLISRPTVAKATTLQRECEDELGKPFPFRRLGFSTFVDYLRSIPSVVKLQPHNGNNPDVFPVASRASSHIDQLVTKQRVAPSKRRGVSRQGFFSSRSSTAPVRRRRAVSQPTFPPVDRSHEVARQSAQPHKGIDVRDLERDLRRNYDEQDLTRNGIHNVDDLLSHAESMVEHRDTKVYPKLVGGSNRMDHMFEADGIPAELAAEFNDSDQEFEFGNEDAEDSEEEMSKKVIKLWSKVLGKNENSDSSRISEEESSVVCNSRDTACKLSVDDPEEFGNISIGMINNFRKILSKYPDGIWASQLAELYYDEFRAPLSLMNLGFTSAISLAASLPTVFIFKRVGLHDSKLYDARYHTLEDLGDEQNKTSNLISEAARFMPHMITENIKKLLEENPNGFRSSDFLQIYEETYGKPLDYTLLGFTSLENFLLNLKDDITLIKTTSGYLLLPKHKIVPYEALEPPKPDERLIIPAEAFCIPIPENVVGLGEEIPHQKLPPVQNDPDKPLLELEIRVAEVISPVFFYVFLDSKYEELETMMDNLHKYYTWEEEKYLIPLPHFTVNLYCAAKYGGYWHRAKITRLKSDGNVEIEYIDYGTPEVVKSSELRLLCKEFATMPAQAICAKLAGLKPLNDETKFSNEACKTFLNIVQGKRLVAHVYEVTSKVKNNQGRLQLNMLLYDLTNRNGEMIINDYLIENRLASPIEQTELTTSGDQLIEDFMTESELTSLQPIDPTTSLPVRSFPSLQEGDTYFRQGSDLASLHETSLTSLLGNRTSLPDSLSAKEEKKSIGPPPGFKEILPEPNFELSTPELSTPLSQSNLNNSQSQTSSYKSAEQEKNVFINNYYLLNSKEMYPELLLQEQCLPQTICRPNLSNIPFTGAPLVQMPHQNRSRQTLTYGSFVPPQNAYKPHPNIYREKEYHNCPPVANYFPISAPVPLPVPAPSNFILVNPAVPGNMVLMNGPAPSSYYSMYPTNQSNLGGSFPSNPNGEGYRSGFSMNPPSYNNTSNTPKPSNTLTRVHTPTAPTTPSPAASPAPAYTPITIPEWPPTKLSVSYTSTTTETISVSSQNSVTASTIKSESSEVVKIPRPITPLTPASAEVANICKSSRPNSSASNKSKSNLENLTNSSDIPQISTSLSDKDINYFQRDKSEREKFTNHLGLCMHDKNDNQLDVEVSKIALPLEINPKDIPLPPPTPEKLFSAMSSPVETLTVESCGSDDYMSASENFEFVSEFSKPFGELNKDIQDSCNNVNLSVRKSFRESKDNIPNSLKNVEMSVPEVSKPNNVSNEDIPDSWENLDLDDTPAKAEDYAVDFSQPLDIIIKEFKCGLTVKNNVSEVEKSAESLAENEKPSLKIQAPVNWKDIFNPDSSLERFDNNNQVREKCPRQEKFGVKKIPVQKLEIQGKLFHLLDVNNVAAVIAIEFFKQFITGISHSVVEKILEVQHNKFYYISKAEHPAILGELNKVIEFCGNMPKKTVIRLNKVRVINLSEIPQCLRIFTPPGQPINQPLMDDVQKISDEFNLC